MRRNLYLISLLLVAMFLLPSCNSCSRKESGKNTSPSKEASDNSPQDTIVKLYDQMLTALLYQQASGEYRALCYQAFNTARLMLREDLRDASVIQPRIIVFDVDETILDNSPYEAHCLLTGERYPAGWDEWCKSGKADEVPGAVDFCKYVRSYGVDVYYITNRSEDQRTGTAENLKSLGFPAPDEKHLIMKKDVSSKEQRRLDLMEKFHISLLFGDNLNDFSKDFESKNYRDRMQTADQQKDKFGSKFIVLPNAMYGDWESALYGLGKNLSDQEKDKIRRRLLKGF